MLTHFTNISYGDVPNFDVLVDVESKKLYVTQPTIERILNYRPNSAREKLAAKSLKAFVGKDLALGKFATVIDIKGRKNNIRAIPYETLALLVFWEVSQGNQRAITLAVAGFNDSFKSLVLEQCGISVDIGTRLGELAEYLTGYHKLHDWVRDEYVKLTGNKPTSAEYARMNRRINQMLFDVDHFNCDRANNANSRQIRELESTLRATYRALSKGRLSEIENPIQRALTYIESNLDGFKP